MLADIRFGARMLLKNPLVTLVALLALALGIGANTAIFSVIHAVMLGKLPYPEPERLAVVWERQPKNDQNTINLGNFTDWKLQNNVFTDMAAFFDFRSSLVGDGPPEVIPSQMATTNLFSVLGVNAIRGRTFTADDGKQGHLPVLVISYDLWQRRFGGDEGIIGRKIRLNEKEQTIVGVMPKDFMWHVVKGSRTKKSAEIWVPWQLSEQVLQRRGRFAMSVARLKPGVTIEQAQAEMNTIGERLAQSYPQFNTNWGVTIVPVRIQSSGELRKPLWILLGAVAFVLFIACANVANLLLARAAARKREIAVRIGLGASRWRIIRQLLIESLMLSASGGVIGLVLAWWGTRALIALGPASLTSLKDVGVNLWVLLFTASVAVVTGLLFGVLPALEAIRVNLNDSLKEGGRSTVGSLRSQRFRNVFVVTEVAFALLLLVGAGLLLRSFGRLQSVDPGFNAQSLLTFRVPLSTQKYDTDAKQVDYLRRLITEIQALPGVESAGAIDSLPFTTRHSGTSIDIVGEPNRAPGDEFHTGVCVTDLNYFRTMQIQLKRGRLFTDDEAREMRNVVVVNESFVRENLGGAEPLGRKVIIYMKDENKPSEIIGVVADNKHMGLDAKVGPVAFWPHPELVWTEMTLVVRSQSQDAAQLMPAVRDVIARLDPQQPVTDVATMEDLMSASVAKSRFNATLLTVFAVVALIMASVGIYGVMSYTVAQRTHEIGIRVALGAKRGDVLRLVLVHGMVLGLIGVAIGIAASFGLTRLLTTLLFEIDARDKTTFALVSLVLLAIMLLACYFPARRATKVNPLVALRYE